MNPNTKTIDFFRWETDIQGFAFHFYVSKVRILVDSSEVIWNINDIGQIR